MYYINSGGLKYLKREFVRDATYDERGKTNAI